MIELNEAVLKHRRRQLQSKIGQPDGSPKEVEPKKELQSTKAGIEGTRSLLFSSEASWLSTIADLPFLQVNRKKW